MLGRGNIWTYLDICRKYRTYGHILTYVDPSQLKLSHPHLLSYYKHTHRDPMISTLILEMPSPKTLDMVLCVCVCSAWATNKTFQMCIQASYRHTRNVSAETWAPHETSRQKHGTELFEIRGGMPNHQEKMLIINLKLISGKYAQKHSIWG